MNSRSLDGDSYTDADTASDSLSTRERNLREYLEKYFALPEREDAIKHNRLYSIEIELTKRCNLECPYCYSDSCRSSNVMLAPDVVKRVLGDGHTYGLRSASWFGGEPLMYPELMDVLRYTRDIGYHESVLYTNGSLITPQIAQSLRGLVDTVAVHLDSIDKEIFGRVHHNKEPKEVQSLHRSTMRGVQNLLDAGFSGKDIQLTLTLCRPVLDGLEGLFYWAFHKLALQTSIFIPIAPLGRGRQLSKDWCPKEDEIAAAYKLRAKYENRPYLLELGVSEYCKQYQMTMCYLKSDGTILRYPGDCRTYGNVYHQRLGDILTNHYYDIAFRDYSDGINNFICSGPCYRCSNRLYCFGTCILSQLQFPACPFVRSVRSKPE